MANIVSTPLISGLTQEQTNTYYAYEALLRGWSIAQQKANNLAVAITTMYTGEIQAIYTAIVPNTNVTVPIQVGLAGASSLNIGAQTVALQTAVSAILATYNDGQHQALFSLAGGTPNMLGTP
jgi:hypothetical protein